MKIVDLEQFIGLPPKDKTEIGKRISFYPYKNIFTKENLFKYHNKQLEYVGLNRFPAPIYIGKCNLDYVRMQFIFSGCDENYNRELYVFDMYLNEKLSEP